VRHRLCALLVAVLLAAALPPPTVLGHSELVTSSPADGDVLDSSPAEITADFSEEVDVAKSSLELLGPDGGRIAVGKVPDGAAPTRMVIAGLPQLEPATYEVRWTTVTVDDNGVERGTFHFAIAAASPSPAATATAAAAPSAAATPTPTPGSTPPASPAASGGVSPAPTAAPGEPAAGGSADLLVPLVLLVIVVVGGAAWLLRRRR